MSTHARHHSCRLTCRKRYKVSYGAPLRHVLAVDRTQGAPHVPDKGRYRGQVICQAHQAEGRHRICQENKVRQSLMVYSMLNTCVSMHCYSLLRGRYACYYAACMPIRRNLLKIILEWVLVSEPPRESSTF